MTCRGRNLTRTKRLTKSGTAWRSFARKNSTYRTIVPEDSICRARCSGCRGSRLVGRLKNPGMDWSFANTSTRSGLRSPAEFEALETGTFSRQWELPFQTVRQMTCYGALQEGATFTAYNLQRNKARDAGDEVLEAIFLYVGRDEAAHAGFYRDMLQLELFENRAETLADLAHVLSNFKMPGDGLIPNYRQRLASSGAGISPRAFLARVVWPLLTTLEITREEMKSALKKHVIANPD